MSVFTEHEIEYMTNARRLARIATVGADGTPHVVPVGFSYNPDLDVIEVTGHGFAATKKFRDVRRHPRAALVADDLESVDPWRPRGIEVRGRAEALAGERSIIRIHPERIVSWDIDPAGRLARSVSPGEIAVAA